VVVIIITSVLVAIALPKCFAAIYQGRVRACASNLKIVNTSVQPYFAQNKEWPTEVSDMLNPTGPLATSPVGLKGGQLTELRVCSFETATNPKPYDLVELHEDPDDATTPLVGVETNWDGHWQAKMAARQHGHAAAPEPVLGPSQDGPLRDGHHHRHSQHGRAARRR